ncbi:MAG: hypothetical protein ACOY40_09195 [Bacillota bacterium]
MAWAKDYLHSSEVIAVPPERLTIDRNEVLRYLGYRPGRSKMRGMIQNLLRQEENLARSLINPRGLFRIVKADSLRRHNLFSDAGLVAFGVCTIGEELEKQVHNYFMEGESVRGVILDAIGTAATEAVTDLVNRDLEKWASTNGYGITRRFSPGYGPWDVRDQDLVFRHLGRFTAGVQLMASKLMKPLKSVSFACKLGVGRMEEINQGRCSSCSMQGRCSFRREGLSCSQAYGD